MPEIDTAANDSNNKSEIEKLVDDLNLIGKNGVFCITAIFDPKDLGHLFVKLYGRRNIGATLNCILSYLKYETSLNNFAVEQKQSILKCFEESCEHLLNDEIKPVNDNTIKTRNYTGLIMNPLTQMVLEDVEKQTKQLGNIGFNTVSIIAVNGNDCIYYDTGDKVKTLIMLGLCIENLFSVLHVNEDYIQKFYSQICDLE